MGTTQGENKFCHIRHNFPAAIAHKSLHNNSLQTPLRLFGTGVSRETVITPGRTSPCGRPNPDSVLSHPSTLYIGIPVGFCDIHPPIRPIFGTHFSLENRSPWTL
jgi:hypothetical protein